MSIPVPGAQRVPPVELLVVERDIVMHVALPVVCEDLIPA